MPREPFTGESLTHPDMAFDPGAKSNLRGAGLFGPIGETLPDLLASRHDERLGRAFNRVDLAMGEA
jgi:hypothetical protein